MEELGVQPFISDPKAHVSFPLYYFLKFNVVSVKYICVIYNILYLESQRRDFSNFVWGHWEISLRRWYLCWGFEGWAGVDQVEMEDGLAGNGRENAVCKDTGKKAEQGVLRTGNISFTSFLQTDWCLNCWESSGHISPVDTFVSWSYILLPER